MKVNLALVGNPNCGKTTLFNALTGTYQKTGNWTGVTVEKKEGLYRKDKSINITDLPGIYSLSIKSKDESVVLEYLKNKLPDVIVNVVDGTNLERNLYLTTQLAELKIPMVIAVNMCDDMKKNGMKLNEQELEKMFSVPVVPVSALKGINLDKLIEIAINSPKIPDFSFLSYKASDDEVAGRYNYIEKRINKVIIKKRTASESFSDKADKILMHKYLGIPIFFFVITLVYFLAIKIGGFFGEYISSFFEKFSFNTKNSLTLIGAPTWLIGLSCGAIINGVGTVLSFLPQILILFTLLTIMEQSGYSARTAFLLDGVFRRFGLSGKSLIPLSLSCGCTVSGIMSTRTIESESERKMTLFLSPFMPCGAKTAVFAWFSQVFFGGSALIASSMYFLSILCVVIFGAFLKKLKPFKARQGAFILEIPTLRKPVLKDIFNVLWEKIKDFTAKAGSVIFIVSVVLWCLSNFGFSGYTDGKIENSILYFLGNSLKFIFYPLGFGNWQASVAVLSGVFAKEAVIETMQIMCTDVNVLFYNRWSIFAFMAFILLSPPCMASIVTAYKELNSKKWLIFMLIFQTISAYIVSLIINLFGILVNGQSGLLLSLFIGIIILIALRTAIITFRKKGCKICKHCAKGEIECPKNIKHNTTI